MRSAAEVTAKQPQAAGQTVATKPPIAPGYRKSLTPFLPATVLRGPLRVRALVLVR